MNIGTSKVTPKMHLLEEHMIPWLHKWKAGLGLMSKQGSESIHARINAIKPFYANMTNDEDRFRHTIMAHHLQVSPLNSNKKKKV